MFFLPWLFQFSTLRPWALYLHGKFNGFWRFSWGSLIPRPLASPHWYSSGHYHWVAGTFPNRCCLCDTAPRFHGKTPSIQVWHSYSYERHFFGMVLSCFRAFNDNADFLSFFSNLVFWGCCPHRRPEAMYYPAFTNELLRTEVITYASWGLAQNTIRA